ncbi:hypothetical protein AB0M36_33440 [Actinoplanes sp. NPDC051346]|uniref:hypothetical protein n=1 Tax=Actinoplanes sp. NPDC051346 TaxID=3155048 RepID=UPI0034444383
MAENVQETKPPEPPPKPPEVPKPTERSNGSEVKDAGRSNETQQSAQQDTRNAAQSEHAKATNGREPDGLRPTPEFQAGLDEHSAAKNEPEGLRPTPEFQARLDEHSAAKNEPEGLRPTPEFQARLDEHSAAKNEPDGLRPTPEFQARLDEHTPAEAGKADPRESADTQPSQDSGAGQRPPDVQDLQDTGSAQRAPDASAAQRSQEAGGAEGDREGAAPAGEQAGGAVPVGEQADGSVPAGEQAGEHVAARQYAAAEHAKATEGAVTAAEEPAQGQRQPAVDQDAAVDQNGARQPAGEQQSATEEQARPPAETIDVTTPSAEVTDVTTPPAEVTDVTTPPPEETPPGDGPPGPPGNGYTGPERRQHEAQHLKPADDLRDQPQTTPENSTDTDKAAETAARLNELRAQGHGPQRHHDPTDEQLAARMGDPILDPQTGEPLLKDNGHVQAQNKIDPMTGTTVDGVHGGVHRCGDYATRIDSPEDYVAADRYMREQIGETGPAAARRPISEVLGPDAHERMTGYFHDPDAPGQLKRVDFTGGTIFALYEPLPNGDLKLRTLYVEPAPSNPDQ